MSAKVLVLVDGSRIRRAVRSWWRWWWLMLLWWLLSVGYDSFVSWFQHFQRIARAFLGIDTLQG